MLCRMSRLAAMARAPVDRILIETDAPVQYGDRFSEPADLHETLFHLSRIKKIPEDKLARIVTKNAERFLDYKMRNYFSESF
ncbi:MAG: TatD family hydrolase [Desulfobacterales bacterium]